MYLADVVPGLLVKASAPYWCPALCIPILNHSVFSDTFLQCFPCVYGDERALTLALRFDRVSYRTRAVGAAALMAASFTIVALADDIGWQLFGVPWISAQLLILWVGLLTQAARWAKQLGIATSNLGWVANAGSTSG